MKRDPLQVTGAAPIARASETEAAPIGVPTYHDCFVAAASFPVINSSGLTCCVSKAKRLITAKRPVTGRAWARRHPAPLPMAASTRRNVPKHPLAEHGAIDLKATRYLLTVRQGACSSHRTGQITDPANSRRRHVHLYRKARWQNNRDGRHKPATAGREAAAQI